MISTPCLVLLATSTVLASAARADACPAVDLAGEPALVAVIAGELGARGIGDAEGAACAPLRAAVEWRGPLLVIAIDDGGAAPLERVVRDPATAATVIESFTRTDVASPLLAARAVPRTPEIEAPAPAVPVAPAPRRTGVHLSASVESSFANDDTTWLGGSVGVCVRTGPICATARLRWAGVVGGFGAAEVERNVKELLIGVDLPIALGRVLVTPGYAGGLGGMETHVGGMDRHTGSFRAEAHVGLAVPVARALAMDLAVSLALGERTEFDAAAMVPSEPWGMVRAGLGLRYGAR